MRRSPWGRRSAPPGPVRRAIENALAWFAFPASPLDLACGCCLGEILFWGVIALLLGLFSR